MLNITVNVLETKMGTHCDKLATTELRWQYLWLSTCHSKKERKWLSSVYKRFRRKYAYTLIIKNTQITLQHSLG